MGVLDRLKRGPYERRFGSERAARIRKVEAQVRALPLEVLTDEWIQWFWRQPPEEWERLVEERRTWAPPERIHISTPEEAAAKLDYAKVRMQEIATSLDKSLNGLTWRRWDAAFAEARTRIQGATFLDGRLSRWLDTLPADAREGGAEICGLLMTMDRVRAAQARVGEDKREVVERWADQCERDYREIAEPFFAIYGKPDLDA